MHRQQYPHTTVCAVARTSASLLKPSAELVKSTRWVCSFGQHARVWCSAGTANSREDVRSPYCQSMLPSTTRDNFIDTRCTHYKADATPTPRHSGLGSAGTLTPQTPS